MTSTGNSNSCVPSCARSEIARLTKEDFDRWTDSVHRLLDSPRARRKFAEFLETRKFNEAEITLRFWERCDRLSTEVEQDKHGRRLGAKTVAFGRFRKEATGIIEMAENDLNFDFGQLRNLREALEAGNFTKLLEKIRSAQNAAATMLADEYDIFRILLLEEKGLIRK